MKVTFLIFLSVVTFGMVEAQTEMKIAYLYRAKFLSSLPEMQRIDSTMVACRHILHTKTHNAELDYRGKLIKYKTSFVFLSARKKRAKKDELKNFDSRIEKYKWDVVDCLRSEKEYLLKPLNERVDSAIKFVVEHEKIDIYVDASECTFFYGKEQFDIGPLVLARLGVR